MKNLLRLCMITVLILISGCGDDKEELIQEQPVQHTPVDYKGNQVSFLCNQQNITAEVFVSQISGYNKDEVVFRINSQGLFNTLMITFKPVSKGYAKTNKDMTGYWDLGLCIPFNKYLLTDDKSNYIRIDSYDENTQIMTGEFGLTFATEKTQNVIIKFSNGKFKAKIDSAYPFRYCIEG